MREHPALVVCSVPSTVRERSGFLFTISAYLLWGGFPIFFVLLSHVNPFETVAWRTIWSLIFAAFLVLIARQWGSLRRLFRYPKTVAALALSGVLLYLNWVGYVYATATAQIIETSLGYFINPFVTIALGLIFRRERLTRFQWVALAIAALAVIQLTISYGRLPWIALLLAFSFGFYGFVKKQAAEDVDVAVGMTVETLAVLPIAIIQLAIVATLTGEFIGPEPSVGIATLLALSGPVTIIPLLLFAAGTKRIPLIYVGFIQFLTPVLSFLFAYLVMHEPMPISRWIGFIGIWVAIAVLIVDFSVRLRKPARTRAAEAIAYDS